MPKRLFGSLRGECRIVISEMEVVRGALELMGLRGSGGMGRKLLGRCIYALGILKLTIVEGRELGMLTGRQYFLQSRIEKAPHKDPSSQKTPLH
jgi:hypothetical protein